MGVKAAERLQNLKKVLDAMPTGYLVDATWLTAHGVAYETFRDHVKRGMSAGRLCLNSFAAPLSGFLPGFVSRLGVHLGRSPSGGAERFGVTPDILTGAKIQIFSSRGGAGSIFCAMMTAINRAAPVASVSTPGLISAMAAANSMARCQIGAGASR